MGSKQSATYQLEYNGGVIECDRITTVLGATKASAGLAYWYGKEERKALKDLVAKGQLDKLLALPVDNDDDLFASRLRDSKADSGTGIHELIHCDATGQKLPDDLVLTPLDWERYKFWEDFKIKEDIEYVDSELRVFSPNLMVAGTLDLDILWKGVFWGLDTKTGRLKRDAAVQRVIYHLLRVETRAIEDNDVAAIKMFSTAYGKGQIPQIVWPRLGVLHIEEDGLCIYEIDPKLCDLLARNFLFRLQTFRDDQVIRPFRRVYPSPKVLKNGTIKEPIWLRAS